MLTVIASMECDAIDLKFPIVVGSDGHVEVFITVGKMGYASKGSGLACTGGRAVSTSERPAFVRAHGLKLFVLSLDLFARHSGCPSQSGVNVPLADIANVVIGDRRIF